MSGLQTGGSAVVKFEHTLTRRMNSVKSGLENQFDDMLTTKDFLSVIQDLRRATPDTAHSIRAQLCSMFEQCGVANVSATEAVSYYENKLKSSNIPTPEQLSHRLYDFFFRQFCENPFPSPEEYIARVVQREIDPEWKDDSLRLQILKTFLRNADGLRGAGFKYLSIKRYVSEKANVQSPSMNLILDSLDDAIFQKLSEDLDRMTSLEVQREERKMQLSKSSAFKECVTKAETKPEDIFELDEEYCKLKKATSPAEWEKAKQSRKQKNSGRGTYALLRIADDLASGRFGNDAVVREEIYLFSIVFGLSFFDTDGAEFDPRYSIEGVMFRDYYSNNLMRYITGKHETLRSGGEIVNPVGRGINFKNYMEAIFLYYSRMTALSSSEAIEKIYLMAHAAHNQYKSLKQSISTDTSSESNRTQKFRDAFQNNAPNSDEEEFLKFIVYQYNCSIAPATSKVFEEENEVITAVRVFDELCEDAAECGIFEADFVLRGLSFFDEMLSIEAVSKLAQQTDINSLSDQGKFNLVLYEVNKELVDLPDINKIHDRKIVSRLDFLKVFYQMFLLYAEDDFAWKESFPGFYRKFVREANLYLRKALMQEMESRNLLDIIIIYSAFCITNENHTESTTEYDEKE